MSWASPGAGNGLPLMTGPLSLYLSPTGSDTNSGTASSPLATFAGVRNLLRSTYREIGYTVTVNPAAGNYAAGPVITGLTFVPADENLPCGIFVNGPWATVTPTTGSATGTLTSVTAGTSAPAVPTVVTDSGASWTVNDFADKFLAVNGNYWPIVSNTATTITLAGPFTVTTSTYAIQEGACVITGSSAVTPPIPAGGATQATPRQACMIVHSNYMARFPGTLGTPGCQIRIEGIKVSPSTAGAGYVGAFVCGSPVIINRCFLGGTASSGSRAEIYMDGGRSLVTNSIVKVNASGNGILLGGPGTFNGDGNLFTSYASGGVALGVGSLASGSNLICSANSCTIKSYSTAGINIASQAVLSLAGTTISVGGQGLRSRLADGSVGNIFINANGLDISNSSSAAIDFTGPITLQAAQVTGGTNTTGWSLAQGSRMKVASTCTLTGTTEVSLDGTGTTLAAMRAGVPKVLPAVASPYGTAIWE